MNHELMKQKLMDSSIKVVAMYGLEKVTTRQISILSNLNEAYIYRYFLDRDDLLKKTFLREDDKMINLFANNIHIFSDNNLSLHNKVKILFDIYIEYLQKNINACLFYTRYYFSTFFMRDCFQTHLQNYNVIKELSKNILKDDIDIYYIVHHLFDILLNCTIKIYNGEIPDNVSSYNEVYNILYSIVLENIKDEYKTNTGKLEGIDE